MILGSILERFARQRSQKEGRKRGEALASREQGEAIKGEAARKDKESTQVSKQTRNQEREKDRKREREKERKRDRET